MVLNRAIAEKIVSHALGVSGAEETLVLLTSSDKALTRFSENAIHQNVSESEISLTVQAAVGKKVGVASGNVNGDGDVAGIAERALEIARAQSEKDEYAGLAAPAPAPEIGAYSEATASYTPDQRADAAGVVIAAARAAKMKAAGSFMTESSCLAVGNSRGVFAYHPATTAELIGVIMADDASGYCEGAAWDAAQVDVARLAEDAVRRAEMSRHPREVKPGAYDLIVEPYAVGEIFNWMAFVIFDTRAFQEGRSLLAKRMGDKIMGDNVTIVDDGLTPEVIPLPFDFEGVPRTKVTLVDRGVARGLCYDLATAAKEGKKSTGHALPPGSSEGPFPLHLALAPGTATRDEMVAAMDHGLYATRFHYVNGFVEPMQAVFTGMTRDGTFWVEDGKIKYGVKNLRWTESMLRAFSQVKVIGRERRLINAEMPSALAPMVYFENFTFTGTTEH